MKRILNLLITGLVLFCSCSGNISQNALLRNNQVSLSVDGKEIMHYDNNLCQMGFNRGKGEFRVHTDNMSDYFVITLGCVPTETGKSVTGDVVWTTHNAEQSRKGVAFDVLKVEGDKIWLWSGPSKVGAIVRVLE